MDFAVRGIAEEPQKKAGPHGSLGCHVRRMVIINDDYDAYDAYD